jgi:hypothetical protein
VNPSSARVPARRVRRLSGSLGLALFAEKCERLLGGTMSRPLRGGRTERHASVIWTLLLRRSVGPVDPGSPGCVLMVLPVYLPEGRPGGGAAAAIDMGRLVALFRPIMRRSLRRPLIMGGNTKRCLSDGQAAVNKSHTGLVLSSSNGHV